MPKVVSIEEERLLARLRMAESELESLRRELDHSGQLATLGTLTAGIAHEINNILAPVLAYAQLADANPSDAALRNKAMHRTIAGVQAAARITEAVLGFARNDDGASSTRIAEIVETSLACLARDPARDGVRVVVDVDPDHWVRIRPLALQQVLLNLVLNSLNALRGRPGELRITADERSDGTSRIEVSDSGPGIAGEMAGRLFEPFVTGHETGRPTATGHGGSGLGLAICKRLIEQEGGTIALDPESIRQPGRRPAGASFRISLATHVPTPQRPSKAA